MQDSEMRDKLEKIIKAYEELQAKTQEFKDRLEEGETLDDILVEAFATVREASWRILRMRPFHVQVMGGIALHQGKIAEMKTGEGKTLVATAANAWAALSNLVEDYGFGDVEAVFLVNPVDFAKQIGESEVFSAGGTSYIENWAGLGTLISKGSVAAGTIYATVKGNIKVYVSPTDGDELFGCYTDETGYIAVSHSAELKSLTYDTVAYVGLVFFAEYIDFIVKGTIAATA